AAARVYRGGARGRGAVRRARGRGGGRSGVGRRGVRAPPPRGGGGGAASAGGGGRHSSLPSRYILFVSTIEPRKNLGVLLDAFERMRGDYDGSLVIVGKVGWKSEDIVPRLRGERVVHLDYVDAPRLATVFRDAKAFVMPSIYEGFGFPLLEAMHHGVPSIAARSSSLPEIGGDAALYFDPNDARELESL